MTISKSTAIATVVLLLGMGSYGVFRFWRSGHLRPLDLHANIPRVVLRATNVIHYYAGPAANEELLVGLKSDGKVQWDTSVGDLKYERETTTISPEQVASIQYVLDATDKSGLSDQMGPYNNYIDTWVELRLRWPGEVLIKPLPRELKSIICEASKLRAIVAKETLEKKCESGL